MTAAFELERFAWADGAFEVVGRWRADEPTALGRARLKIEIDGRRRRIGAQGGKAATAGPGADEWRARFSCARRPTVVGPGELEVGGTLVIELPTPELPPPDPEPAVPPPDVRGAEALLERLRSERAEMEAATKRLAQEREAADAAARRLAEERAGAEAAAAAAHELAERAAKDVARRAAQEAAERTAKDVAEHAAQRTARDVARNVAEHAAREAAERAARSAAETAAREAARDMVKDIAGDPAAGRPLRPRPVPPAMRTSTPRREAIREALERPREPKHVLPDDEPDRQRVIAYAVAVLIVILIVLLVVLVL